MISEKSVLAIVPARGGSKGLPGKNIRPLCGKPLIAWSIEAGLASRYVDEVMVTTDSEEIAIAARSCGAQVPFLRPAHLALDTSPSYQAIEHAILYYKTTLHREFGYLVLLEPTSPLRETSDIDEALSMLDRNPSADAIVGVCKAEGVHPAFMFNRQPSGMLAGYEHADPGSTRRQDVSDLYFPEGTIYASRMGAYLERKTFYHEKTMGYVVPKWKAPEVDDIYDLVMIEAIMKYRSQSQPLEPA